MAARTILFIHQAFPGQFFELAKSLARDGNKVFALCMTPQRAVPGVTVIRYMPVREQEIEGRPFLLQEIDAKLVRGESIYKAMKTLKEKGLNPDIIYVHPGWGEALFIKNVWPKTRLVVYAEWFYSLEGQEVNFDPAMPRLSEEQELRLTLKNTSFLHALSECDVAIAPTEWQKSRFPEWAREKIMVVHDGINLVQMANIFPRTLGIPSQGIKLRRGMPIITFCAMHLEPLRGFHYFMRALPAILSANPEARVIVMGNDAGINHIGYGAENPAGTSWRKSLQQELGDSVDWSRVHFLGVLERQFYLAMLKLSACHIYLTTPFILSWSFLEAAGLGLPIIASNTAPVLEFDGLKGVELVDFTDVDGLAMAAIHRLSTPPEPFYDENREILLSLDISNTLPAIKEIMYGSRGASNMGDAVEEIIFIEE